MPLRIRLLCLFSAPLLFSTSACRRPSPSPSPAPSASAGLASPAHPEVVTVSVLTRQGGRLDWSPDGRRIAFDRPLEDHCTDLFVMAADGTAETCITCDHDRLGLPAGHKGNPAWHPSGDWIVIQAERETGRARCSHRTSPSRGVSNELWAVRADGSSAVKLVSLDPSRPGGNLDPHFDPKGQRLLWSHMLREPERDSGSFSAGEWTLRIAPFSIEKALPSVGPSQDYSPGRPAFYDAQGFTPDGAAILFAGHPDEGQAFHGLDVAAFDLAARSITRRVTTTPAELDRTARVTPAGRILFSSTRGLPNDPRSPSSDFWVAEPDGATWRLTRFNEPLWELKPPKLPLRASASDGEFSPDGSLFAGFIATDEGRNAGTIVTLRFSAPL